MVQVLDQSTEQAHLKDFFQTNLTPQEVHEEQSQIIIREIPHSLDSIVAPSGGHLQEQLSVDLSPLDKLVNPNIKLTNESEEDASAHPQKEIPGKPPLITQSAHLSKKERKKLQQIQILEAHTSLLQATNSQSTFSDDLLLFVEASSFSALPLKHIFEEFYSASGLQLNTSKSQVFTNCSNMEFSQSLEIPQHHLPVRYLGMPLFTGALTHSLCQPLVDQIHARVQSWTGKTLSITGRLELIWSVLSSFHIYRSATFTLPQRTIKEIEKVIQNFLWQGCSPTKKLHHLNWLTFANPLMKAGWAYEGLKTGTLERKV
ncbi:hypothetical protein QJS10_CPB11g00897 [Acorus calamus]|uniref:Reverse transcriptase n=1 Tax=Acorus calamus TaxID=4465 RepID=A0AAV9DR60_ACOCL|nr:hypothetical protein QJS10_CPB11g00897 [Acorus calamus]